MKPPVRTIVLELRYGNETTEIERWPDTNASHFDAMLTGVIPLRVVRYQKDHGTADEVIIRIVREEEL